MTTFVCEASGMEKIAALRGGASHARRQGNMQDCGHKIQGIIDGQVVVTHSAMHTHHALQSTLTMVTHTLHGVRDGLDVQTHDFLVDLPTDSEAPRVFFLIPQVKYNASVCDRDRSSRGNTGANGG